MSRNASSREFCEFVASLDTVQSCSRNLLYSNPVYSLYMDGHRYLKIH